MRATSNTEKILDNFSHKDNLIDLIRVFRSSLIELQFIRANKNMLDEKIKATSSSGVTDIVTAADNYIEQKLRDQINELYPDWGFWGEETIDKFEHKPKYVVVDPIEGTKNFKTYREEHWGSVIALIDENRPVIGIVGYPNANKMLVGLKNNGAYELEINSTNNNKDLDLRPVNPSIFRDEFTYNFSPHFEQDIIDQANKFKQLGEVVGHEDGSDKIAKLRESIKIDGKIFRDFESGAIEAILNRGTIYFKTSAEMAAVYVIINELGGKVSTFEATDWSINADTMVSARSIKDYNYLMCLVKKIKEL